MFYKNKKVLTKLIISCIFLILGVFSIAAGLLYKFVFAPTDEKISNIVILSLSIIGVLFLFNSFILVLLNQNYLQNINNNLLEENKKQWEAQINKEISDPSSDFVLADESFEKPEIEEDEIININIVNDVPAEEDVVVKTISENITNNIPLIEDQKIVENPNVVGDLIDENSFITITKHEEIINDPILEQQEQLEKVETSIEEQVQPIVQQTPINIPPRTIPNQPISGRQNVVDSMNKPFIPPRNPNNSEVSRNQSQFGATNRVIPPRTAPNIPTEVINSSNDRPISQRTIPNSNSLNNQNIDNQPQRTIPPRTINIPPKM